MFIRRLHKNTQVTLSYNAKGNKSQINTENNNTVSKRDCKWM